MDHNQKPVIAIVGPTGIGKTKLSITLALQFNGEVISVDSLQVYREGRIMTAQATLDEMKGVRHHMINYLEADEEPSNYVEQALQAVRKVHASGRVAILCGGSMSLTEPLLFSPSIIACRPLVITLSADSTILGKLTDDRIEDMISNGLLEEVEALRRLHKSCNAPQDCLNGVWKSIGYPELRPYFEASNEYARDRVLEECASTMKRNTRHYSWKQQNWIWSTLLHRVYRHRMQTFQLRVHGKATFRQDVEEKAIELTSWWLMMSREERRLDLEYAAALCLPVQTANFAVKG